VVPNAGWLGPFATWHALGIALKAFPGGSKGRALWDHWSAQSEIYDAETQEFYWTHDFLTTMNEAQLGRIIALLLNAQKKSLAKGTR
jgi:hypothetical protein